MSNFNSVRLTDGTKYLCFVSGLGALSLAYGVYRLMKARAKHDEYFKTLQWQGGCTQRYILVLGLQGAGKTRLLQCFQPLSSAMIKLPSPEPTVGHNIHSVGIAGVDFHFWEVGKNSQDGGEPNEYNLASSRVIDVILWVVDSTQPRMLPAASEALHKFLENYDDMTSKCRNCHSNSQVVYRPPVVIVASKQDLPDSLPASRVLHEMRMGDVSKRHKVYVVGTRVPDFGARTGLWRLYELLMYAEQTRCRSNS